MTGLRWDKALPWVGLGLFLLLALLGDKGILRLWHLDDEHERLEQELLQTSADSTLLEKEVRALRNDPQHIERVAREDLGLVREGEVLYRFKD